jgi:ABC-type sugar transport system substrate-binding protein
VPQRDVFKDHFLMPVAGKGQCSQRQQDQFQHELIVSCVACEINHERGGWSSDEGQGLVAPTLSGIQPDEIRKRIERFRIPIVIMDVNPFEGGPLPPNVYHVGVDNADGGRQAAAYMRQSLTGVNKPRVLVLANHDQPKRHEGFLNELGQDVDTKVVFVEWAADAGRRATEHALKHYAAASPLHAVFGVSDEIALGAVEALSNSAAGADVIVVGFDGFPSVRTLIDLKISAFRNTVIRDAYQMGEMAMGLLRQAVEGKLGPGTKREQILGVSMYV